MCEKKSRSSSRSGRNFGPDCTQCATVCLSSSSLWGGLMRRLVITVIAILAFVGSAEPVSAEPVCIPVGEMGVCVLTHFSE